MRPDRKPFAGFGNGRCSVAARYPVCRRAGADAQRHYLPRTLMPIAVRATVDRGRAAARTGNAWRVGHRRCRRTLRCGDFGPRRVVSR